MANTHFFSKNFNKIIGSLLILYLPIALISAFLHSPLAITFMPIVNISFVFIIVCLHGIKRFGFKNFLIFFLISWVVSHFFEALSVQVGFPFGHHKFVNIIGPSVFQVPLLIMCAYFAIAYVSWILATALLSQYNNKLIGMQKIFVPIIATFIMVMWDVCLDPDASLIRSLWIWGDPGIYFGVPLENYFGWFLVGYIVLQIFALYIAKHDWKTIQNKTEFTKLFWLEVVATYAIMGLTQVVLAFGAIKHADIYKPLALITLVTMIFVSILAYFRIENDFRK